MHEYIKKALIAVLLVVSSAFVSVSNVADFPDRTSEMAHAAARSLFWQFWDELLSRELARWTKMVSDDGQQSDWPPEFRNALTCLLFRVFLERAFEGSLSVVGEMTGFSCPFRSALSVVPRSAN